MRMGANAQVIDRNNDILLPGVSLCVYLRFISGLRLKDRPPTAVADRAVAIRGVFWVKERAMVLFACIS